jgi:hypothetical protein
MMLFDFGRSNNLAWVVVVNDDDFDQLAER